MPGKGKKNLRQRKQQPQQKPSFSNKSESTTDKDVDDDWELLNHASKNGKKQKPYTYALLAVVFLVGLLYYLATNNDPINTKQQESDPEQGPQNQEQQWQKEQGDGFPVANVIPSYGALVTLPHEITAFTQGLCFRPNNDSVVYESTGMYNESEVRMIDLSNGNVLERRSLPEHYFGEGMTYFPDAKDGSPRFVLLTWREQTGFIYDADTLEVVEEFSYKTTTSEGWGITYNPRDDNFIVSDGSAFLHFWDRNFTETGKVEVKYKNRNMYESGVPAQPLQLINELEWDDRTGVVLANVYFQDMIVAIDPETGYVTTIYDLRSLYTNRHPKADVFNGIALNSEGEVWVTGKYWSHLYQVQLEE